jgi:hypothetical protein
MKELSQHILDIMHNSLSADATLITLEIVEDSIKDRYLIKITDNGRGITPDMLKTVTDPYTTSRKSRKVGMGLPLFKMSAEQSDGYLTVSSEVNKGTEVEALFKRSHIDRPDIGDIEGTIVLLLSSYPDRQFVYTHTVDENTFSITSNEIQAELDGLPLNNVQVIRFLKEMIFENLKEIGAK